MIWGFLALNSRGTMGDQATILQKRGWIEGWQTKSGVICMVAWKFQFCRVAAQIIIPFWLPPTPLMNLTGLKLEGFGLKLVGAHTEITN